MIRFKLRMKMINLIFLKWSKQYYLKLKKLNNIELIQIFNWIELYHFFLIFSSI
jgi:hypothetical protein